MRYRLNLTVILILFLAANGLSQPAKPDTFYLLKPDRVFDGETMHEGWQVLVRNGQIESVGAIRQVPPTTTVINLKGCTLLPGLIEGHTHLFLHPYNETRWDDQVLKESRAERIARAVNHARATLLAGFTTVRDLGTEGMMYDDAGLRTAIEKGVIPGPHMLIATRAIVARGSYAPQPESPDIEYPQGAAEVGNAEELAREIRTQLGKGADLIKIYADFHTARSQDAHPTFLQSELDLAVRLAASYDKPVVIHATTAEGMRRAALAGASTIEHGDLGTPEVFRLMKEKGVAYCPTIAADEANEIYQGWKKGTAPEPESLQQKRKSVAAALAAGVTICMGGDAGVFAHGDNAREMELMVEFGMKPLDVLRSATSVNADVFRIADRTGRIKPGLRADLVAVAGNPAVQISQLRQIKMVMKAGVLYK